MMILAAVLSALLAIVALAAGLPKVLLVGDVTKWDGDQLIAISAFWDSALQARQIGLG
jgi:hypothetical protein